VSPWIFPAFVRTHGVLRIGAKRMFSLGAAVCSASLLAACVFFVPSPTETSGGTCGLTSSEKSEACGSCLAKSCQVSLDACCAAGKECEGAISAVVLCKNDESECRAPGAGLAETNLRTCAKTQCEESCGAGLPADGGADTSPPGNRVCEDVGEVCGCRVQDDAGASGSCMPSSRNGACCASLGFPAVGETCACWVRVCSVTRESSSGSTSKCSCGFFGSRPTETSTSCTVTIGTCCAGESLCDCDRQRDTCPAGTREVTGCSASDLGCGSEAKSVSRCSL
jgi:hypothetical protein